MNKAAITIKDVAREARVSVATVSRALNGHENVAEPVRKLVLEVAARLRYTPHAAARSLSSRRTNTIGVVLPDLYGEFFSELMRGIDGVARERRQHLLVSSYHGDQEQQGAALRAMRGRVDGLLVLSPYAESPGFLTDNLPQSLPTALINTYLPEQDHPVLSIDDHAGAMAMTRHLLDVGHRRIAFISGRTSTTTPVSACAVSAMRWRPSAMLPKGSSCPVTLTKLPAIAPDRSCWQPARCPTRCSPPTT